MPTIIQFNHPLSKLSSDEFDVKVGRVKVELDHFVSTRLPALQQAGFPAENIHQLVDVAIGRANAILGENARRLANGKDGEEYGQMRDLDVFVSLSEIRVILDTLQDKKAQIQHVLSAPPVMENESDCCERCGKSTLTKQGDALADVLICDGCDGEYHLGCSGLKELPEKEESFVCHKCSHTSKSQDQDHRKGGTLIEQDRSDSTSSPKDAPDAPEATSNVNVTLSKADSGFSLTKVDPPVPPVLVEQIHPDDEWIEAWSKLEGSGFYRRKGIGLMDFCIVVPGRSLKGGKEGVDYFATEKNLQEYCAKNYGWDMEGHLQRMEDKWSPYAANGSAVVVTPTQSIKTKTPTSKAGKRSTKIPAKAKEPSSKFSYNTKLVNDSEDKSAPIQPLKSPKAWRSKYKELLRFKDAHGHCIVPVCTDLGEWVTVQRDRYKGANGHKRNPLLPKEIRKLEKIGFVWSKNEAYQLQRKYEWAAGFEKMKAYKEKHGHCEVTRQEDASLHRWVDFQRQRKSPNNRARDLDQDEKEKLASIGFQL